MGTRSSEFCICFNVVFCRATFVFFKKLHSLETHWKVLLNLSKLLCWCVKCTCSSLGPTHDHQLGYCTIASARTCIVCVFPCRTCRYRRSTRWAPWLRNATNSPSEKVGISPLTPSTEAFAAVPPPRFTRASCSASLAIGAITSECSAKVGL